MQTNVNNLTDKTLQKLQFAASLSILIMSTTAYGESKAFEPLSAIRKAAETYALQQIDDTGLSNVIASTANMDSRLHLTKCDLPLETSSNSNSNNVSRITVGVRCSAPKPWSIYIPVKIDAQASVIYTSRPLVRGEALKTSDLEIRQVSLTKLPANYLKDINELNGMEITRSLRSGSVLTLNSLTVKQLIQNGQEVVILAKSNKLQVRMNGVALKNGVEGELIPVQNTNSGRTIEAKVLNGNTVIVNL